MLKVSSLMIIKLVVILRGKSRESRRVGEDAFSYAFVGFELVMSYIGGNV